MAITLQILGNVKAAKTGSGVKCLRLTAVEIFIPYLMIIETEKVSFNLDPVSINLVPRVDFQRLLKCPKCE